MNTHTHTNMNMITLLSLPLIQLLGFMLTATRGENALTIPLAYSVDSFDAIRLSDDDDQWKLDIFNGQGWLNITEYHAGSMDENKDGNTGGIRIDYKAVRTANWGGYVSFGMDFKDAPISCSGADYLSLKFKVITAPQASEAERIGFRMIVMDDSNDINSTNSEQEWERYYSFQAVLGGIDNDNDNDQDGAWKEIQVPLIGDDDPASPLYLPGWSGAIGNGRLDLNHLRGWDLEFNIDSQGDEGTSAQGSIAFKDMLCVQRVVPALLDGMPADAAENGGSAGERNGTTSMATYYGTVLNAPLYLEEDVVNVAHPRPNHHSVSLTATRQWTQTIVYEPKQEDTQQNNTTNDDDENPPRLFLTANSALVHQQGRTIETQYQMTLGNSSTDNPGNVLADQDSTQQQQQYDYQISVQYQSPYHLYFNLSNDVTGILLDAEWIAGEVSRTNLMSEQVSVEFAVLAENNHDDDDDDDMASACPGLQPEESCIQKYVSKQRHFIHLDQPQQLRFDDFVLKAHDESDSAASTTTTNNATTDVPTTIDWERIKGFAVTFHVSILSQFPAGTSSLSSTASYGGKFHVSDIQVELTKNVTLVSDDGNNNNNNTGTDTGVKAQPTCNYVPGISADVTGPQWVSHEFLGSQCCDVCIQAGSDCMYYMVLNTLCFIAPYLDHFVPSTEDANGGLDAVGATSASYDDAETTAGSSLAQESSTAGVVITDAIKLSTTEYTIETARVFWKDDVELRDDFCEVCICNEEDESIDCRDKDLIQIPKTATLLPATSTTTASSWKPKSLDLRNNPRLLLLGGGVLSPSLFSDLEEIWLPETMLHISPEAFDGLTKLTSVNTFESTATNMASGDDGAFADVCCSRSNPINEMANPADGGLSFCKMDYFQPGIDSVLKQYTQYFAATEVTVLKESSAFMAEAAESASSCAEYCSIAEDCNFFTYDARWSEAEQACRLLSNAGEREDFVCCSPSDYADQAQTQPGFVSGYPPRTRHIIDNARVEVLQTQLTAHTGNSYTAQYQVRLGSNPRRGAVWIDPVLSSASYEKIWLRPFIPATLPCTTMPPLQPSPSKFRIFKRERMVKPSSLAIISNPATKHSHPVTIWPPKASSMCRSSTFHQAQMVPRRWNQGTTMTTRRR